MKQILILLLLFFPSNKVFTQNHIEFMGIPLGKKLHSFVFCLKQKGFKDNEFENSLWSGMRKDGYASNLYSMKGKFLGVNNQGINIYFTDDKTVKGVNILYHYKSWSTAINKYSNIKSMLTQKYGKLFLNPIPKDDRGKVKAIQAERGEYKSTFNVKSGRIEVSICCLNNDGLSVVLNYEDFSVKERKPIDDL